MAWANYATICRLCLQQDGFLLAIFNNNHINENTIQRKIIECTTLEISSEDGLPSCICHRCLYKLEMCLEFKQQCLLSDATLKQVNGQFGRGHLNGDYDQTRTIVSVHDFEKFSHENQKFIPDHGQNVENVVMVVNPDMDYDSDNESEYEQQNASSDIENPDTGDFNEQLRNVFMCKYCDRAYIEREECRKHELTEHNSQVPFLCAQCEMAFADRTNYTSHLKSVHQNDKPFGCPQCPRSFSRRSDLRKHTVVHTGIKPYTCKKCYKSFSRNTNLTKHLRIHSGHKPYVCPQCPKTFISKGDLTRHALIHTGHKPFACAYCDQSFGRRDKLVRHEKRHFPNGNEDLSRHSATLMQQAVASAAAAGNHKPFACGYCDQSFGRRDKLVRHEKRHFPNGNEDRSEAVSAELELLRQQMGLSGYSGFSNLTDLPDTIEVKEEILEDPELIENNKKPPEDENHAAQNEHEEEWNESGENMVISVDPFNHDDTNELMPRVPEHITGDSDGEFAAAAADAAAAAASNEYNSSEHNNIQQLKSTVNAIKKYPCFVCHKRFSSAESLRFHTATHSGNKPHACTQCPKSFLRKRELDRHMTTHSGMKPFKCNVCKKAFGRKDKLVRHTRIHTLATTTTTISSPTKINPVAAAAPDTIATNMSQMDSECEQSTSSAAAISNSNNSVEQQQTAQAL